MCSVYYTTKILGSMAHFAEAQAYSHNPELDEILRLEAERKHAIFLERRRSYLFPNEVDVQRQADLLAARGYSVVTNSTGTEILSLNWPSEQLKLNDYRSFCRVVDIFWATQAQSDHQFHTTAVEKDSDSRTLNTFQRVEALLMGEPGSMGMPFFRALHDPSIKVSPSHRGVTPAAHSLNVLDILSTQHLESNTSKFLVRASAAYHDLGKLFIADKDIFQDHASFSFYIFREFLARYIEEKFNFGKEEAWQIATKAGLPIKYHHIFELVEDNFLSEQEAAGLVGSAGVVEIIATLALADRMSVKKDRHTVFAFMVFFSYEQLLKQLAVSDQVERMAERLKQYCLNDVSILASQFDQIPLLVQELALPVITEVLQVDVTLEGLLRMLSGGILRNLASEQPMMEGNTVA